MPGQLKFFIRVSFEFNVEFVVKNLLAIRNHSRLCEELSKVFPKLFRFEACAVLFYDKASDDLFQIKHAPMESR